MAASAAKTVAPRKLRRRPARRARLGLKQALTRATPAVTTRPRRKAPKRPPPMAAKPAKTVAPRKLRRRPAKPAVKPVVATAPEPATPVDTGAGALGSVEALLPKTESAVE
jgi:hypothetical protein